MELARDMELGPATPPQSSSSLGKRKERDEREEKTALAVSRQRLEDDIPRIIKFSVEGRAKLFTIEESRLKSAYFVALLGGQFKEGNGEIEIRDTPPQLFKKLLSWLKSPEKSMLMRMEIDQLLRLSIEADKFALPDLVDECDRTVSLKIEPLNIEDVFNQLEAMPACISQHGLLHIKNRLIEELKQWGLTLSPDFWSAEVCTVFIHKNFDFDFPRLSFFKAKRVKLTFEEGIQLNRGKKKKLSEIFQRTEECHLTLHPKSGVMEWTPFLYFKELKIIRVSFLLGEAIKNNPSASMKQCRSIFLRTPDQPTWVFLFDNLHLSVPVARYPQTSDKNMLSIDDFIFLKSLEAPGNFFNDPLLVPFHTYVTDNHVQGLIQADKFDREISSLDLRFVNYPHFTARAFQMLLAHLPKINDLSLNEYLSLALFYYRLPYASQLNQLTIEYSMIESLLVQKKLALFMNYFLASSRKNLFIECHSKINPLLVTALSNFSDRLTVTFNICIGQPAVSIRLLTQTADLILINCSKLSDLTAIQIAQEALKMRQSVSYYIENLNCHPLESLISHSNQPVTLQLRIDKIEELDSIDFSPLISMKNMQHFMICTPNGLPFSESIEKLKASKALSQLVELPYYIYFEGMGLDTDMPTTPLEGINEYIKKAKVLLALIPNFDPFHLFYLQESFRSEAHNLSDEEFAFLNSSRIERKNLDLSGMQGLTVEKFLAFIKKSCPKTNFRGCDQIKREIESGELLPDVVSLMAQMNLEFSYLKFDTEGPPDSWDLSRYMEKFEDQHLESIIRDNLLKAFGRFDL